MHSGRAAAGRGRERAVLAAGLGSAVALIWAAWAAGGDPELAGRARLDQLADEMVAEVEFSWDRLLRGLDPPVVPAGDVFPPYDQPKLPVHADSRDLYARAPGVLDVFDTLLDEAARVEIAEGDLEAAHELVLQALSAHEGAPRRAEGLLRAVQLGVRLERNRARGDWLNLWDSTDWADARGDTSYRLVGTLAVAPLLGPEDRTRLLGEIVAAWSAGELVLPVGEDQLVRAELPAVDVRLELAPELAVLVERIVALDPSRRSDVEEVVDRGLRATVALAREIPELPRPTRDGRWHHAELELGHFLSRAGPDGANGFFFDPAALARAVADGVALFEGFEVDFDGTSAGEAVRDARALAGGPLSFTLRHTDPERFTREESGRTTTLRAALGILALLCAAAGFFTSRALGRERRLAALKSAFIAGVSHDLRTPLASILLMAENLEEGRVREGSRAKYYGSIRREADRLRRLVDDVLDFSRIERGEGTKLSVEDVELPRFFDELHAECAERVERAGGQLEYECRSLPASAPIDAEALRRAVWNLVDNALRHSESVEVGLRISLEGDDTLLVAVSDRGTGIPESMRDAVFRPFERLPGSNGHVAGSGLGLAIVREVALAHAGSAIVRSGDDGVGSVFELRLDLSHAARENPTQS